MDIEENDKPLGEEKNPILIKASLKSHSPEEIYDYIRRHVGELGMKIKKRQAIIGFENPEFYKRLLTDHKIVYLHGKTIEFHVIPKADENLIDSEEEEVVIPRENPKNLDTNIYPNLDTHNVVDMKVNLWRLHMLGKVQNLSRGTLEITRQRVDQLKLQFKESGPRQREIFSLENAVDKKVKSIETKFEQEMEKLNKFIQEFSIKPNSIDLEPTFQFEEKFEFPQINSSNMKFDPAGCFLNNDHYPCKRIFPINGSEFAVTMKHQKYLASYVRIYDVNESNPKETISIDSGVYGICRVNNYLIVGSYDSSLKYIDLDDEQRQVETSSKICEKDACSIFEIKVSKPSVDKPEIITLSTDNFLRKFEVTFDEICPGVYSANFERNWEVSFTQPCYSFEMVSSEVIMFGSANKVKRHQMEKNITREINTNSNPVKIKKFSHNLFAVASGKIVELIDIRNDCVVQSFNYICKDLISLEVIGEHSMMYGAVSEIGLIDDRKQELIPWKSEAHHRGSVYDILKLKNKVVSVDNEGMIYSWQLADGIPKPLRVSSGLTDSINSEIVI